MIVRAVVVFGVLMGGSQMVSARCDEISDQATTNRLLELVRPVVEYKSPSQGYDFTMEKQLEGHDVIFKDCGKTYQVGFVPKRDDGGRPQVEDKVTYVLSKKTGKVFDVLLGEPTDFPLFDETYFEERSME